MTDLQNQSMIMNNHAPSLGGQPRGVTGREPGLSRDHRPERIAEVAALMLRHRSVIVHDRFYATLVLGEYPDHPRAVAAVIRSARDECRIVCLAAIFAMEQIIPRIGNASLKQHAITALGCIIKADTEISMPSISLRLLFQDRGWQQNSAGRALAAVLRPNLNSAQLRSIPLGMFAKRSLHMVGAPDVLIFVDPA